MRPVLPISLREFVVMFQKCAPPSGFPDTIAVAHSGGPDSTCLLALIKRSIELHAGGKQILPDRVVSLTVDHSLQPSSSAMADQCAKFAAFLNVEHLTTPIPWSEAPFPPKPSTGEAFEGVARLARQHVLFRAMTLVGAKVLALGHHADDQVETSLMRLGRETTELGAAGMRSCRRWGMGHTTDEGSLGWAGSEGMRRWVVRPLLEFGKDRILATCEENKWEYVNDPTNFQPEVTLRNALRCMLADGGQIPQSLPTKEIAILDRIKEVAQAPPFQIDLTGGLEPLRAVVKSFAVRVDEIDRQVDHNLKIGSIPSLPGTFLLSTSELATIHDETVQSAMILRILRYVSFYPWGSFQADGNRKESSIRQIVEKIWNPDPWEAGLKRFTAGGGTLWHPVSVDNAGAIKFRKGFEGERTAWLASRLPPIEKDTPPAASARAPLHLDVTDLLAEKLAWSKENEGKLDEVQALLNSHVQVLWDQRFLVRFLPTYMPTEMAASISGPSRSGKIVIAPFSRWYLPAVTWKKIGREPEEDVPLISVEVHGSKEPAFDLLDCESPCPMQSSDYCQGWIHIGWARSLNAV